MKEILISRDELLDFYNNVDATIKSKAKRPFKYLKAFVATKISLKGVVTEAMDTLKASTESVQKLQLEHCDRKDGEPVTEMINGVQSYKGLETNIAFQKALKELIEGRDEYLKEELSITVFPVENGYTPDEMTGQECEALMRLI